MSDADQPNKPSDYLLPGKVRVRASSTDATARYTLSETEGSKPVGTVQSFRGRLPATPGSALKAYVAVLEALEEAEKDGDEQVIEVLQGSFYDLRGMLSAEELLIVG